MFRLIMILLAIFFGHELLTGGDDSAGDAFDPGCDDMESFAYDDVFWE